MWNRVKKMFKKKKLKKDPVITYAGGEIGLKEILVADFLEDIPHGMKMHTKFLGRRCNGLFAWEVNGVVFEAEDIIEAQRKYLRRKRD